MGPAVTSDRSQACSRVRRFGSVTRERRLLPQFLGEVESRRGSADRAKRRMKTAARIARLEQEGLRLSRRIGYVQTLYESERLRSASGHLQAALADLRIAKIGAEIRRPARDSRTANTTRRAGMPFFPAT
jgi:hypothetical protein